MVFEIFSDQIVHAMRNVFAEAIKELVKLVLWLLVTVFYSRSIWLVWDAEFRCVIDYNFLGEKNVPTKKNMIALSS